MPSVLRPASAPRGDVQSRSRPPPERPTVGFALASRRRLYPSLRDQPKASQMLAWLKKNRARRQTARFLYGSIVTAARNPLFYACWGTPDTVQGRFELLVLHMVLVQHRLLSEGDDGRRLARTVSEAFVTDMDDQMREMTFGDLSVPREIRGAAAALFDRWQSYRRALSVPDEAALSQAIAANFAYLNAGGGLAAERLAAYLRRAAVALAAQPAAQVLAGRLAWPDLSSSAPDREPQT